MYARMLTASITVATLVSQIVASGVIVPLYIYPASAPGCAAWSPLISAYVLILTLRYPADAPHFLTRAAYPVTRLPRSTSL